MDIVELRPPVGEGVFRSYDDGLVVLDHFKGFSAGSVRSLDYGIVLICTSGMAQFAYDDQIIKLGQNELFVYFAHSVIENFMCSSDFDCREVWFSRGELWDTNMYGMSTLSDLVALKQHPKVALSDAEFLKLDTYYQLLCQNLKDSNAQLGHEIMHSLFSTLVLEILSLLRGNIDEAAEGGVVAGGSKLHGKLLADKFIEILEQSDGRIRRVDDVAQMLNVTPKYLSKLLMKTMNRKPSVMVSFFTLRAIENRLRYTDKTMQQIADELNFSSASAFGKFFRDHHDMTPLEYRKKYHEDTSDQTK